MMSDRRFVSLDPQALSLMDAVFEDGFETALLRQVGELAHAEAGLLVAFPQAAAKGDCLAGFGVSPIAAGALRAAIEAANAPPSPLLGHLRREPILLGSDLESRLAATSTPALTRRLAECGFGTSLFLDLQSQFGTSHVLLLLRPCTDGFPVAAVEGLGDHLGFLRALIRQRIRILGIERAARLAEAAADWLCVGILVVDGEGHPVMMNAAAREALRAGDFLRLARGQVALAPTASKADLLGAIKRRAPLTLIDAAARATDADDHIPRPRQLLVRPLGGSAGQSGEGDHVGLFIVPDAPHDLPSGHLIQLYGLTPAEERLALCLLAGTSLGAAATGLGIREHTARSYLKRVFAKIGVKRQSELVSRLMADAPPLRASPELGRPADAIGRGQDIARKSA